MRSIHVQNAEQGTRELAAKIVAALGSGKPVLWLICGGSNIPVAATALGHVRSEVSPEILSHLTLALTDERYGPVGHPDSNWQQLIETGADLSGFTTIPILSGASLEQTVSDYARNEGAAMDRVKAAAGTVIALFGIGPDGHIAGIIPHSPGVSAGGRVAGYDAGKFTRVTLTFASLKQIDAAYTFAFGDTKKEAVQHIVSSDLSLEEEPAQILKQIGEAYLYSDFA